MVALHWGQSGVGVVSVGAGGIAPAAWVGADGVGFFCTFWTRGNLWTPINPAGQMSSPCSGTWGSLNLNRVLVGLAGGLDKGADAVAVAAIAFARFGSFLFRTDLWATSAQANNVFRHSEYVSLTKRSRG